MLHGVIEDLHGCILHFALPACCALNRRLAARLFGSEEKSFKSSPRALWRLPRAHQEAFGSSKSSPRVPQELCGGASQSTPRGLERLLQKLELRTSLIQAFRVDRGRASRVPQELSESTPRASKRLQEPPRTFKIAAKEPPRAFKTVSRALLDGLCVDSACCCSTVSRALLDRLRLLCKSV